eukprot:m51a1_g11424 hypothetical protein (413) ;mRNA; f:11986-13904
MMIVRHAEAAPCCCCDDGSGAPAAKSNKRPRGDSLASPWSRCARTLGEEVLEFAAFVDPSEEELEARAEVVERVQQVATVLFRTATPVAVPFGSLMTGLMLPDSDIDITIDGVVSPSHHHQAIPPRLALTQMAQLLTTSGIARNVNIISSARVPIIKAVDAATGYHVDISFGTDLTSCHFIADQMVLNPVARPVVLVLKQLLRQRGLNETYTGGLGSYALSLMVLHVVTRAAAADETVRHDPRSSGAVLRSFLELFAAGGTFDAETCVVPPLSWAGVYARKRDMGFVQDPWALSIADPLRPGVDVGRPTTRVADVRAVLREALDAVRAADGGTILGRLVRFSDAELEQRARVAEGVRRRRRAAAQEQQQQQQALGAASSWAAAESAASLLSPSAAAKSYGASPRRPAKKFRI